MTDYINVCRTAVAESFDDGYEKGLEKGCEKGLEKGRVEMALDMLADKNLLRKLSSIRIFPKKRFLSCEIRKLHSRQNNPRKTPQKGSLFALAIFF